MIATLVRNTLSNGGLLVVRTVLSLTITPFLIISLGKEVYGLWNLTLAFSISGAFSILSLGFHGALVKYIAEYHAVRKVKEMNEIISAAFFIYSCLGIIGGGVIFLVSKYFLNHIFNIPPDQVYLAKILLYILACQLVFELPGLCFSAILEGLQRFDLIALMEVVKLLVTASGIFIALSSGGTVISISLIMAFAALMYVGVMAISAKRLLPHWQMVRTFDRKILFEMIDFTKDLFILRINGIIYNNMDKIIIGTLLSSTFVTDYDIANRIHSMALMAMGLAPSVVMPTASAFHAGDEKDRLRILLVKGTKYTLALALPVIVALFVLAEPIISYWISPSYSNVALYARLFLTYLLFWSAVQIGWNMLVGVKEVKPIVRIQIFSVILNLGLTLFLVPRVGVAGTMIGTIIGNAVAFFPYMKLIFKRFDVKAGYFFRTVILAVYPQAVASGVMLFLMTLVRYPQSLVEVGLYALAAIIVFYILFYFTGMDSEDKERFFLLIKGKLNKVVKEA